MQLFDVYPAGTAGGCCFITKRYEVGPDEKVISLDVDLDSLPPHGLLCVSEEAVRQLNVILGWDADEHGRDRRRQLEERVAELEAELATFEEVRASLAPLIARPEPVAEPEPEPEPALDPDAMTKAELLAEATRLDITGRHTMSKDELRDAVLDAT